MCLAGSPDLKVWGRRLNTRQSLRPQRRIGAATTVVRCQKCGLIAASPTPVPVSVECQYDMPPESYWAGDYLADSNNYMRTDITEFARLSKDNGTHTRRALDVGAGVGKAMRALAAHGFDTYGIEPSAPFRDRAVASGIDATRLQRTSIEDAVYESDSFDFIVMNGVVEHFVDPSSAIRKAVQWLRPGGLVYVEVPSSNYLMARLARMFYRATGSDYIINISPMHPPYHLFEFTLRSFAFHASANGYGIAAHRYEPCESYMPKWVAPVFDRMMRTTNTGMQLIVWLTK
jgi:SAM-dependent methyltransferase